MPKLNHLELTLYDRWASLVLNRPDKLNAIHPAMLDEISVPCAWLNLQEQVVLISGAGTGFSEGFDLSVLRSLQRRHPSTRPITSRRIQTTTAAGAWARR